MTSILPAIPVPEEHQFLTVPEVATFLRVSKMTVYRLVHRGELESIKAGRSFRVPRPALELYLKEQKETGQ